jgi:hypothetical protein
LAPRDDGLNSMARVAAGRVAEQMRIDLDTPAAVPGLVVVIQNRDGSQDVVSPPPAPMIEHDPLAGQMGDLEPQGPRN